MQLHAVLTALVTLLGAPAERPPLKVVIVSGSEEYESAKTMPVLAKRLEAGYNARATILDARGTEELPGLEALEGCDVALFFTRRLTISGEPLERVKKYCLSGRPVVALRTGSHGFQNWLDLDRLVLGGNYHGHYDAGPTLAAAVVPEAKGNPILEGVGSLRSRASLYKTSPLGAGVQVLLTGSFPGCPAPEPLAWTRVRENGGRVFYTSLGAQGDIENEAFRRLVANALFWAAGREVERREPPPLPPERPRQDGSLTLKLRTRVEAFRGSGVWEETSIEKRVPVAETALLICDLWDQHWCRGATQRCGKLAERVAVLVEAARARGVQIIHCPSDTMDFYAGSPARRRMQLQPQAPQPKLLDLSDPPLPIDDSDGGCDTDDQPSYAAWTRQHPAVSIADEDGISDQGSEVYNLLKHEGITTVLVTGVHTNMCVLGRSFAIRQLCRLGIRPILVRDLTDTMYDPKDRPFVSHEQGTELVVQHIERYWCPTVLSSDVLAGLPGPRAASAR